MGGEEEREKGGFSFQLVIYDLLPGFFEILKIALRPIPASPHPHPKTDFQRFSGWLGIPMLISELNWVLGEPVKSLS